jgi:hypothetical protein
LFGSALRNVSFFSLLEIALRNLKNKIQSIFFVFLFELFRFITMLFLKCSFRMLEKCSDGLSFVWKCIKKCTLSLAV